MLSDLFFEKWPTDFDLAKFWPRKTSFPLNTSRSADVIETGTLHPKDTFSRGIFCRFQNFEKIPIKKVIHEK